MDKNFDIAVIGGGVIGGTILRELTKYQLSCVLLEKEDDVCAGQSRANSGIVHAGFDAKEGTLKAKFNVLGNVMMEKYAKELGVKYINNGSLVVAYSNEDCAMLDVLLERGKKNGVKGLEIIDQTELRKIEPNIADGAMKALLAKTGGIVCPHQLTIASIGNAMDNGAKLYTNFEVVGISGTQELTITAKDGRQVSCKLVINCAGLGAGKIANIVGDDLKTHARKGEYILLDRESGDFVNHTLFCPPSEKGKGILVSQTVDGNIILGPTSEEIDFEDKNTTASGLDFVIEKTNFMTKKVPLMNTITSFTGVRAYTDRHDFVIEYSKTNDKVIHCLGIESPGLTSAPAIAKFVVEDLVSKTFTLTKNKKFNGKRKAENFFKNLSNAKKNKIIKSNPAYGRIVCRCEQITEGEIVNAITVNPPANSVDGVKLRTRAGMGRCQGGFCQPAVAEIIAREKGIDFTEVTKKGKGSNLVTGVSK